MDNEKIMSLDQIVDLIQKENIPIKCLEQAIVDSKFTTLYHDPNDGKTKKVIITKIDIKNDIIEHELIN